MPLQITRKDVQRMTAEGAVLIDTLPESEYVEEHIAGAVNIPLRKLDRQATAHLAKDAPLIVYCVQATLGHASVATTGRYLHARPSDSSARYLSV